MKMGAIQGGTGALFGGIAGGIRARSYGGDLWTGKRNVPILTGKLAFNGNVQIAAPEVTINSTYTEIKVMRSHAELRMTNNNNISAYNVNYDGSEELVGSFDSRSGGVNPGPETQWGGMTPSGSWDVTSIEINNNFDASFVRDNYGFKARLNANFTLPANREAGTFLIHPDGGNFFGSNGCPVLQCGANELSSFALFLQKYISRHGPLKLYVIQ